MTTHIEERRPMHREESRAPRTPRQQICHLLRQFADGLSDVALMAEHLGLEEEWPRKIREQQAKAQLLAHEMEMRL